MASIQKQDGTGNCQFRRRSSQSRAEKSGTGCADWGWPSRTGGSGPVRIGSHGDFLVERILWIECSSPPIDTSSASTAIAGGTAVLGRGLLQRQIHWVDDFLCNGKDACLGLSPSPDLLSSSFPFIGFVIAKLVKLPCPRWRVSDCMSSPPCTFSTPKVLAKCNRAVP